MQEAKSIATLVDTSAKLVRATEDDEALDRAVYQSAVHSLLYLSTGTRPDITFAVAIDYLQILSSRGF
jgi:radical SAM superfamily enzyme